MSDTPVTHSAAAACGHIHMHIQVIVRPACYLLREHETGLWSCAPCCLNIDQRERERERERESRGVQTGRKAGDWRRRRRKRRRKRGTTLIK